MKIYYENHTGERLNLSGFPYLLETTTGFDFEWNYDLSNKGNYGSKVTRFYRNSKELTATIAICANSKASFCEALNHFFETTEKDIIKNQPGKLVTEEGEYLSCYIVKNEHSKLNPNMKVNERTITIISTMPFWYKVSDVIHFEKDTANLTEDNIDTDHLKFYDHDYSYDYAVSIQASGQIVNDNIDSADFKMTIHGEASVPYVTIGNATYQVNVELARTESLIIDTIDKTVYKLLADGTTENVFHERGLDSYIFERIPPGTHPVIWPGTFSFDVVMYQRRSEPKWNY